MKIDIKYKKDSIWPNKVLDIEDWSKLNNGIIQKPLNYLNKLTDFEHREVMKKIRLT